MVPSDEAEAAWLGSFPECMGWGLGWGGGDTPLPTPLLAVCWRPDAVCTRSVTVRLPSPAPHGLLKLKHGVESPLDGQDVQIPLLQGGRPPPLEAPSCALSAPPLTAASSVRL